MCECGEVNVHGVDIERCVPEEMSAGRGQEGEVGRGDLGWPGLVQD